MFHPALAIAAEHEWLVPTAVIFVYLAVVLYIGIFAFRKGKETGEDFFLASRSIGPIVFFLSLFATNMTSFAIIGSSGMAYKVGIGVFGMMASSSGLVIPLTLFFIGTRLWALGKRFGHMTQVAYFRDRWECSTIGTVIFLLTAAMMIPYLIISIVGGGTILEALTDGKISYPVGGAIVALVVMGNVFFGGMRGAVWVNVFQTILFLCFGAIAFVVIGHNIDGGQGFNHAVTNLINHPNPTMKQVLNRERIPTTTFLSYMLIPLSSIMFPHMSIMCFTAKKVTAFRKTVVLYPMCIMAIWLPCVFLGAVANGQPKINAQLAASSEPMAAWLGHKAESDPALVTLLAQDDKGQELVAAARAGTMSSDQFGDQIFPIVNPIKNPKLKGSIIAEIGKLSHSGGTPDAVLLKMLHVYVPALLAGLLAAGIISAVMGSDCHQILALSTMFTKDIFDYYGGRARFGEKGTVFVGRSFIIFANLLAYIIALWKPPIFELAISWAFSGFASFAPVMLAALFWKRSTKYGALAAAIFVAASIISVGLLEKHFAPESIVWSAGGHAILTMAKNGKLAVLGFMPVVPMVVGSALCVIIFSLLTRRPSQATLDRYFNTDFGTGKSSRSYPVGAMS